MKMQTKAIHKTTICFFLFFPCLYYLYLFDEDIYLPTKVHNFTEKYVSKIDK